MFSCYEKFRKNLYYKHGRTHDETEVNHCNFQSADRFIFNKHVKSHLKNSTDGIKCPFSSCSTSRSIYYTAAKYDVGLCRVHFDDGKGTEGLDVLREEVSSIKRGEEKKKPVWTYRMWK